MPSRPSTSSGRVTGHGLFRGLSLAEPTTEQVIASTEHLQDGKCIHPGLFANGRANKWQWCDYCQTKVYNRDL